jgi:hypothetical protein
MSFKFFAKGRAAGQFLAAVDRHGTRAADGGTAGIAERQASVTFVLDTDQGVQNRHSAPDFEPELL